MDTYEKKYKEANDKIAARFGTNVAKEIFTDLYESEDEKIRKDLIAIFKGQIPFTSEKDAKRYIAWLEKQNNQKSIDDLTPQEAMDIAVAKCFEQGEQNSEKKELKKIEQNSAWSEEDEIKIKSIIAFLKSPSLCAMDENKGVIDANIKYLKSLKGRVQPQNHWKPSNAQIGALLSKLPTIKGGGYEIQCVLETLYDDLKKLKGE